MGVARLRREAVRFTYQDYLLLPDETRCELLEGEFRMSPAPETDHQRILKRLGLQFVTQLEKKGLGEVLYAPVDVVLSDEDVVQPDVLFVSRERLGIIQKKCIRGAPDLVIEIVSPRAESRDRVIKRKLYDKFGVREYWIVDPEARSIEVIVARSGGFKTSRVVIFPAKVVSPTFPMLRVNLRHIFV